MNEFGPNWGVDDSRLEMMQVVEQINDLLLGHIANHFVVWDSKTDRVYGKPQETRKAAAYLREELAIRMENSGVDPDPENGEYGEIISFSVTKAKEMANRIRNMSLKEMGIGKEYYPLRDPYESYVHGLDDGYHEAENKLNNLW
jgi:hypothetical protein